MTSSWSTTSLRARCRRRGSAVGDRLDRSCAPGRGRAVANRLTAGDGPFSEIEGPQRERLHGRHRRRPGGIDTRQTPNMANEQSSGQGPGSRLRAVEVPRGGGWPGAQFSDLEHAISANEFVLSTSRSSIATGLAASKPSCAGSTRRTAAASAGQRSRVTEKSNWIPGEWPLVLSQACVRLVWHLVTPQLVHDEHQHLGSTLVQPDFVEDEVLRPSSPTSAVKPSEDESSR